MTNLRRIAPQPLTALVVCGLALTILVWSWAGLLAGPNGAFTLQTGLLTLFLGAAVVVAGLYPIHIRHHTKVALTTPAFYIMALLLPAPLAALAAGLSVLAKEWLLRAKTGNTPSDIATAAGRWVLVAFLSAGIAHQPALQNLGLAIVLVTTALVMFAGDVVSVAFEISPMCGVPPAKIMAGAVREGGLSEAVQYLLGMLGVIAALREIWALALLALPIIIAFRVFKSIFELQDNTRIFLEGMADAVDLRDPCTGGHSRQVADWCARILDEMNTLGPEADLIVASARVHDIGKIGIPDAVLMKPDRLTPEETKIMQAHTQKGAELLGHHRDFARGVDVVRSHHERWDGAGYPARLAGFDIPFGARVIAVADAFDAMTSDRPYRRALPLERALSVLRQERGRQFDPAVVDAFLSIAAAGAAQPAADPPQVQPLQKSQAAQTA